MADALREALQNEGIAVRGLNVEDDKSRGTTVSVALAAGTDPAHAARILGRFAFPFSIT